MTIRFGSVCSGVEAASMAWEPLGWAPAFFAEIDPFPRAVLAHRYPAVPLHGDFTLLRQDAAAHADINVLAGGTPCQAFSVAGLRKSLDDDRGNLTLEFVRLADAIDDVRHARGEGGIVVFWENVPGVLSTKDNAFGCFLAALVGADAPLIPPRGQRWTNAGMVAGPRRTAAWRVLDAQYFGLAQRRERVFVVASSGDGPDPSAILFEPEGVRRHSPPSRDAREAVAGSLTGGFGTGGADDNDGQANHIIAAFGGNNTAGPIEIASALRAKGGTGHGDFESETFVAEIAGTLGSNGKAAGTATSQDARAGLLVAVHGTQDPDVSIECAHPLGRNSGQENAVFDPAICFESRFVRNGRGAPPDIVSPLKAQSGTDGRGDGAPLVFQERGRPGGRSLEFQSDIPYSLTAPNGGGRRHELNVFVPSTAYTFKPSHYTRNKDGAPSDIVPPLTKETDKGDQDPVLFTRSGVRRLLPVECERLQGMPRNWTLVPYRGGQAKDGPRYKAIGNSWAVNVARWIGKRIDAAMSAGK